MTQNISTAVMQRRAEPHDSLDYFPTPPWATRALCEWLIGAELIQPGLGSVWEPAAGEGHMARPLGEYFAEVWASDVHDYGAGVYGGWIAQADFLIRGTGPMCPRRPDWVITNPPLRLAQQFAERAWGVALEGCALLVRTAFLEGVERYRQLYRARPPAVVLQFAERVPMHKGRLTATGSTATAYCWLIWLDGARGTTFSWIPPCRKRLERPGDYPPEPPATASGEG